MRNILSDAAIAQLIEEDVPYFDLTTFGLGIGQQLGAIAEAGIDMIQFDKVAWATLKLLVESLKQQYPSIKLAVAGGITLDNVQEYASTGVDLLVTSFPYFGQPADIGVKMLSA